MLLIAVRSVRVESFADVTSTRIRRVTTEPGVEDGSATPPLAANIRKSNGLIGTDRMARTRSLVVQTKNAGVVLLHWTSHMVHLSALTDGAAQRETFQKLATNNLFQIDVLATGLMHKVRWVEKKSVSIATKSTSGR